MLRVFPFKLFWRQKMYKYGSCIGYKVEDGFLIVREAKSYLALMVNERRYQTKDGFTLLKDYVLEVNNNTTK